MNTGSLEGKHVLVAGASSGIGRAVAAGFAREGARVVASARRESRLRELRDELAKEGHEIAIHAADAAVPQQLEGLHQFAVKANGAVDILVYATGTNTPDRAMKRLTPALWDELLNVNLVGAYYLTRAVLPAMREAGAGHLIYISSISGIYPDVSGPAYQAAKRGLLGMAHAIRVEEKENGIRTCVICPGLVDTEILNKRLVRPTPEMLAKALQPEDVAETVLFVAKLPARASIPELQMLPAGL
jgi:NADP-dependent 3-hydroxy acid dehydrogenase YdfG